jgi:hypothetical protein
LLSLYGNFIGFQPLDVPQDKIQEITIDPTLDPLLLVINTADQAQYSSQSTPVSMAKPIFLPESFRQFNPTSILGKNITKLNTNIPSNWHQ